ncbi:MAG TPA: ATP-binding cassette domain-containing protein [Thermoleophilaceae bacterium]|nr:ATP-binding cassette domain-containing protein [Thermoleophilaceae bacterium]
MPLLQLESANRSFWRGSTEIRVLRDVTLSVDQGDFVAVYGQRSAGKTTLLKTAAGFEPLDAGSVTFRGEDLAAMSRRRLTRLHRDEIAWVEHAGPRSFGLSMRAYVALPLLGQMGAMQAQRRAASMLEEVGVDDSGDRRWDELSDAARMLVAIAHALVRKPDLLIVDDPTVGLGMADRDAIVALLRHAADDGVAILMAVPDMPAMVHADQVHSLSRGRLLSVPTAARGSHGNVLEFPGRTGSS